MRIAQIAPLYEAVPPKFYGGTERVVSYLTEALVDPRPRRDAVCERRFGHLRQARSGLAAARCASTRRCATRWRRTSWRLLMEQVRRQHRAR